MCWMLNDAVIPPTFPVRMHDISSSFPQSLLRVACCSINISIIKSTLFWRALTRILDAGLAGVDSVCVTRTHQLFSNRSIGSHCDARHSFCDMSI